MLLSFSLNFTLSFEECLNDIFSMMPLMENLSIDVTYLEHFFKIFYVLRILNFTWPQTSTIVKNFSVAVANPSDSRGRFTDYVNFLEAINRPNLLVNSLSFT